MKILMISSAIAAAIAASAFGVNAQTAPAAPKAGAPLIGKVLKTSGTNQAVATNTGEVEGTESEGGENGGESGGDSD